MPDFPTLLGQLQVYLRLAGHKGTQCSLCLRALLWEEQTRRCWASAGARTLTSGCRWGRAEHGAVWFQRPPPAAGPWPRVVVLGSSVLKREPGSTAMGLGAARPGLTLQNWDLFCW